MRKLFVIILLLSLPVFMGQGRFGLVLGDPTGIDYYLPQGEKSAIDVQAGFSYYWIGYWRLSAGYARNVAEFDLGSDLPKITVYGRGALAGELGIFSGYDRIKAGVEARIGFKFIYNNKYEIFMESGPCIWLITSPSPDWGGVLGIRLYK